MIWIILAIAWIATLVFALGLCAAAKRGDEAIDALAPGLADRVDAEIEHAFLFGTSSRENAVK